MGNLGRPLPLRSKSVPSGQNPLVLHVTESVGMVQYENYACQRTHGEPRHCLNVRRRRGIQRGKKMKFAIVLAGLLSASAVVPALAQKGDNKAFCAQQQGGSLNCAYDTMAACEAAIKGGAYSGCTKNPDKK
jgi:hypothetical protein